jgi:hypothetical protein
MLLNGAYEGKPRRYSQVQPTSPSKPSKRGDILSGTGPTVNSDQPRGRSDNMGEPRCRDWPAEKGSPPEVHGRLV